MSTSQQHQTLTFTQQTITQTAVEEAVAALITSANTYIQEKEVTELKTDKAVLVAAQALFTIGSPEYETKKGQIDEIDKAITEVDGNQAFGGGTIDSQKQAARASITHFEFGADTTGFDNNCFKPTTTNPAAFFTAVTAIEIPRNVTAIGNNCFQGMSGLDSLTFIDTANVTIGVSAFEDTSLTYVKIPASVSSMGHNAFKCVDGTTDLPSLLKVEFENRTTTLNIDIENIFGSECTAQFKYDGETAGAAGAITNTTSLPAGSSILNTTAWHATTNNWGLGEGDVLRWDVWVDELKVKQLMMASIASTVTVGTTEFLEDKKTLSSNYSLNLETDINALFRGCFLSTDGSNDESFHTALDTFKAVWDTSSVARGTTGGVDYDTDLKEYMAEIIREILAPQDVFDAETNGATSPSDTELVISQKKVARWLTTGNFSRLVFTLDQVSQILAQIKTNPSHQISVGDKKEVHLVHGSGFGVRIEIVEQGKTVKTILNLYIIQKDPITGGSS